MNFFVFYVPRQNFKYKTKFVALRKDERVLHSKMEFIIGNRFKLLNKIGIGGFGEVYKALDTKSNQVVALKLENRTQGAPLLHYEKKLLGRLKGLPCLPNIVQNGVEGDFNYLAMEFIGYSLEHYHTFCGKKFSNQVKN